MTSSTVALDSSDIPVRRCSQPKQARRGCFRSSSTSNSNEFRRKHSCYDWHLATKWWLPKKPKRALTWSGTIALRPFFRLDSVSATETIFACWTGRVVLVLARKPVAGVPGDLSTLDEAAPVLTFALDFLLGSTWDDYCTLSNNQPTYEIGCTCKPSRPILTTAARLTLRPG